MFPHRVLFSALFLTSVYLQYLILQAGVYEEALKTYL